MIRLRDIKLIIWDLDETLWEGTLSEGDVTLNADAAEFIRNTADMGIVHSVCSKNDFGSAMDKLRSVGLGEYFLYPSVNWESKGTRVKGIITAMKLRPANVLFVDDRIQNLREAEHYSEGIMTALPGDITHLYEEAKVAEKTDPDHERHAKYRQMEQMDEAREEYDSNEEFLRSCNIRVEIVRDPSPELDRIAELVSRTNQLNFTKLRQSREELEALISTADCGTVRVTDKFGDHGTVGFFAVEQGTAKHFLFSCRIMGMGVEQYVYNTLGRPSLTVTGDVASSLDSEELPRWINTDSTGEQTERSDVGEGRILFKGPCDLDHIFAFIKDGDTVRREFTYTSDTGILVEGYNHTASIVTALTAADERKAEILSEVPFLDPGYFTTSLTNEHYDHAVLSMLLDGNLGVYRRKSTGECIGICEKRYDLTDPANTAAYVSGSIFTSGISFTEEMLRDFADKYEFVPNPDGEQSVKWLDMIYRRLCGKTKLTLILGSEVDYGDGVLPAYENRHTEHKIMNERIRSWASDKPDVTLVEITDHIRSSWDYSDHINHFSARVYYELAGDIANAITAGNVDLRGGTTLLRETLHMTAKKLRRKLQVMLRGR